MGCDPLIRIEGHVTIPPDVQARFSNVDRGVVLLRTDDVRLPRSVVGVLCEPSFEPLRWQVRDSKIGCPTETRAEIVVLRGAQGLESKPCGALWDVLPPSPDLLEIVARGEQPIFAGKKRSAFCPVETAIIDITVKSQ